MTQVCGFLGFQLILFVKGCDIVATLRCFLKIDYTVDTRSSSNLGRFNDRPDRLLKTCAMCFGICSASSGSSTAVPSLINWFNQFNEEY